MAAASSADPKPLVEFLLNRFTPDELRRLLRGLPDGREVLDHLPNGATPVEVTYAAVDALMRRGLLEESFFRALLEARPRLAQQVDALAVAWLGRPVSSASPGQTRSSHPAGERPAVVLVHGPDGLDAAWRVQSELARSAPTHDVLLLSDEEWTPQYLEAPTVAVVVVCTSGLFSADSAPTGVLRSLRGGGSIAVVPLLVTTSPWRTSVLGRRPALPSNSVPLERWADPQLGWADIKEGLTRILIRPAAAPPVAEAAPTTPTVATPPPVVLPINRIFRTTGVPDINFVAPAQLPDMVVRMRFLGESLVIEGPSGIGKTTAMRTALEQALGHPWAELKRSGRVIPISGKSPPDLVRLAELLAAGEPALTGHLVIDDFHHLAPDAQRAVADLMKVVADAGSGLAKIVVVGINPVGTSLVQRFPDLANRFYVISMTRQPDAKVSELIERGAQAANVTFIEHAQFVRAARGSFYTAQLLCLEAALLEGVIETAPSHRSIVAGPSGVVLDRVHSRMRFKYQDALVAFAAWSEHPPPQGATLVLLHLLAADPDGTVSVVTARTRHPELAAAFDWLLKSNLARLFEGLPRLRELFYYNRDAAVLSAEDPQLEFYLANLSWPALARDSGHVGLEYAEGGGFRFAPSPAATVTVDPASAFALPPSRVLHLSDLHFGSFEQCALAYDQLFQDLRQEQGITKLDAVVVTGDITTVASPGEFQAACEFFKEFQRDFSLAPHQIVLVPGNHDLSWAASKQAYAVLRREDLKAPPADGTFLDKGEYVEVRDESRYAQRFAAFAEFYYSVRLEPWPLDYESQATIHAFPAQNLLILGLNSAYRIDHHFRDRADIHGVALGKALRAIEMQPGFADTLKIAAWHHPIQSPDDGRLRDTGFVERLAQAGFRLALHGHVHHAQTGLFRYDMSAAGRRLDILGAGTFAAPTAEWVPGYPLQYQVLEFRGPSLTVHTRRRETLTGAWQPDARWSTGKGRAPLPSYVIGL